MFKLSTNILKARAGVMKLSKVKVRLQMVDES